MVMLGWYCHDTAGDIRKTKVILVLKHLNPSEKLVTCVKPCFVLSLKRNFSDELHETAFQFSWPVVDDSYFIAL